VALAMTIRKCGTRKKNKVYETAWKNISKTHAVKKTCSNGKKQIITKIDK
jgi:hypothetical protein